LKDLFEELSDVKMLAFGLKMLASITMVV